MQDKSKLFRFVWRFLSLLILGVLGVTQVYAQDLTVRGQVLDTHNEPIMGAKVLQQGTTNGTMTNMDGEFTLKVPQSSQLEISFVGFKTVIVAAKPRITVTLEEDLKLLDEVVVIGYGSVKKKDVTTAITSVSTDDIESRPITSTGQALQGKAAGLSVVQPNGAPGAGLVIRIRGTTSLNGSNDPLYVVDGVPVDNLDFLAPTDIADIQILKDASSAAIYGSRAANGVVLVTTKSGKIGQPKVTLNIQYGTSQVVRSMESLNTEEYRELQEEIGVINLPDGLTDRTDWFSEAYHRGTTENYQISASDGNERMRYYLSAGYMNEKGVLPVAFYKRYSFRSNVEGKLRDWLKLIGNISYSDYTSNGITSGLGANRGGVVLSVINTPKYAPIWDPDHPGQYFNNFYGVGNITNPLENMARSQNNKSRENRLIASGSVELTMIPNLLLKSTLSLDRRNAIGTSFLDPISTAWGRNQHGEASDNRNMNTVLTWDNVATYNKSLGDHNFDLMLGSSYTRSEYLNSWINGSHFRSDDIMTLNVANKISWTGTGTGGSEWAILSYFSRLQYNYQGKYLLTANIRSDSSSKLHPDHRTGYFPSVSGAWRISAEPFMQEATWLDDLKIRAGIGRTGNQSGIGDYSYLQRYNPSRVEWFKQGQENAMPVISPANLRTPDLTWEKTTQTNIGMDLTAWKSRLTLSLDYYFKRTTDMLMHVSLPKGAAIASSIVRNEGEMTNQGVELQLHSRNILKPVVWETDFNISFNRNELASLELQKVYNAAVTSDFSHEYVVRNEPGRPLGGFYGYISDGVDPETGELMYRDLNGDGKISSSDRTYIGDPNPLFTFGLTNRLDWKGLSLSIFLQGSYGNDVFNASRIETEGMFDGKNQSTRVLDRWRIPGQITDVPKAGFDLRNSSYFVEDGSYLRVKEISLGYDLANNWLHKYGISRMRPFITATNLFTLTKYSGMDPEVNQWGNNGGVQGIDWGTYPQSKSFTFGVNVEF